MPAARGPAWPCRQTATVAPGGQGALVVFVLVFSNIPQYREYLLISPLNFVTYCPFNEGLSYFYITHCGLTFDNGIELIRLIK
jgi:hypothetical protein